MMSSQHVRLIQDERKKEANERKNELNLQLTHQYHAGDKQALAKLLEANRGSLIRIVRRYSSTGIPQEDLLARAEYGYCIGIQKFQEWRGVRLNTCAMYWAQSEVSMLVKFHARKKRSMMMVSYDASIDRMDDNRNMDLLVEDPSSMRRPNAVQILMLSERVQEIRRRIAVKLSSLERFILCRYFGFDDCSGPMTYKQIEVLPEFQYSGAYARLLCSQALRKIGMTKKRFLLLAEAMNVLDTER